MALAALALVGTPMWLTRIAVIERQHARAATMATAGSSSSALLGTRQEFTATAYCKGHTTSAGVAPRHGVIAGDPSVLPLGSIVEIDAPGDRMDGLYSVLDTGPKIRGRRVDLYVWSCHEALAFGRQTVAVRVLRAGWHPAAISKAPIDAND